MLVRTFWLALTTVKACLMVRSWLSGQNWVQGEGQGLGSNVIAANLHIQRQNLSPTTTKDLTFPHIVKVNLLRESDFIFIDFTAHVSSVQTSPHSCLMCCYNLLGVRINSLWLEDPSGGSLQTESFLQGFQKKPESWPKVDAISPNTVFNALLLI